MKTNRYLALAVLSCALVYGEGAEAAPITFNTALPLSDGEMVVREQVHYVHIDDALGPIGRKVKVWKSITAAGYGVSDRFAVFGVIPLISKQADIGQTHIEADGLADIKLFGRYQIYRKDGPGTTTRIAPFLGVNLPTGQTGKTSDGSTDIFGGLILTRASTGWNLDSQIKYVANGKHNSFERGNTFGADVSLQVRLNPHDGNVNSGGYLFGVLEAKLTRSDKDKLFGIENANSGGTSGFVSPGVQYATKRIIYEGAVMIPVIKDMNGTALQAGTTVIGSVRFNF